MKSSNFAPDFNEFLSIKLCNTDIRSLYCNCRGLLHIDTSFCATVIGLMCQNEHHYGVLAFQDCNCRGLLHIDMSFCATVIGLMCQNEHHYGVLAFQDCNCRRLLHIYTSFCATLIRFSNARLQKQRASDGLGY